MVLRSNELDFLILQNGKDGTPADSKYIWVKYSQSADGSNLTDDPTNAIYIGIAYNKESQTESSNPDDYTWTKIKGDKGDAGQDAYSIILENDHVSFSVSNENTVLTDQSFTCQILVFQGTTSRTDFTIGDITSSEQHIHITKQDHTLIISVNNGEAISANSGIISVPVTIDGLLFYKDISWNVAKQGNPGQVGESSVNIILYNESQNILSDDGYVINDTDISIPFVAFKGTSQIASSVVVGSLPSGVSVSSNTASTSSSNGEIRLHVNAGVNLGGSNLISGYINLTFSASGLSIPKRFLWTKIENGDDGNTYDLSLSGVIILKDYDGSLDPQSITLKAFQLTSNGRVPYSGRFIISQSYIGDILTDENNNILTDENNNILLFESGAISNYEVVYTSSNDESEYTYNINIDNVHSIICQLCEAGSTTKVIDQQTVTVLSNYDQIKPIIEEITTTLSGALSEVDAVQNQIMNKVWQSDITTQINNYDNSTIKTIRDQVSQQTISISGIQSTVSDIQSEFDSTTQSLSQRITQAQQTADKFSWLVKSNSSSSSLTLTDAAITAVSQQSIFKSPDGSATVIEGGRIKADSITANMIAANAITSSEISANAITSDKIAANAITSGKIAANAITAEKINSGAITADKIATNAITSGKIAADAVTADKLNVSSLSAISANLGTITAGSINIGSGKFTVSSSGVLTATGATISGVITATSGKIGGLSLSSALYSGSHSSYSSTADGVYLGTEGLSIGENFKVSSTGRLEAKSVSLDGNIIARNLQTYTGITLVGSGPADMGYIDYGNQALSIIQNNGSEITLSNGQIDFSALNGVLFNGTEFETPDNSDNWKTVIKFPNGTMIAATWIMHQVSISTAWGSGYCSQQLWGTSFGATFKNKPMEFFMASPVSTTTANVCSVVPMYNCTTTTSSSFYLFAPATISNMQWYIKIIAIGRWK